MMASRLCFGVAGAIVAHEEAHPQSSLPLSFLHSVSDDCSSSAGGGTLQIWCIIDLLYRPEEEVLAELDEFRSNVAACSPTPTKDFNHSA
ncbi:WD-40 repeat-containing protein MSI4-like isoform X4 [Silene latifolia]|uniref:WD-40 repeat-containing protein MSI4-like isoform X4 n=1 Tax=Silene latifolia TaxID=37657 RepID=UPI003D782FEE